jgi:hypothetical protein
MTTRATMRLSAGAVHLLSILDGYCVASARTRGESVAFVSQRKLAERLQRSLATVKRCLTELVAAGLVQANRGYKGANRYTMGPTDSSSMSRPDSSSMSRPDSSSMSCPDSSSMSCRSPAPLIDDLVIIQQHQTATAAAAEAPAPNTPDPSPAAADDGTGQLEALEALTAAGLAECVARPYAEADAGGLCALAAAYYAERAANGKCTLGLLRDMLNHPAEYFRQDTAGDWQPPRDSMIYKNMKAAALAVQRREQKTLQALHAAELARQNAESAAKAGRQLEADAAAWAALAEDDRRGIEQGVNRELPATMTREAAYPSGQPTQYRLTCYRWMRRYAEAAARETAWQALCADVQAQLEAEATRRFPLWAAASPAALHSICLMLMPEMPHEKANPIVPPQEPPPPAP